MLNLAGEPDVVVQAPSGVRLRLAEDSVRVTIALRERGFYEVRSRATALGAGRPIAVNVELAESDLSHVDPAELVAALTARSPASAASSLSEPAAAPDVERRQSIWWYLLLAAAMRIAEAATVKEAVLPPACVMPMINGSTSARPMRAARV